MSAGNLRELVVAAFGSEGHALAEWYAGLLSELPALRPFTAANAAKIRKKARHAGDTAALRDLRCELAVAATLADRRSQLVYEPLAAAGRRGPDFMLRHKGHSDVYVEVSRLRPGQGEHHDPAGRLAAVLCGKLGQLAPGAANLLIIVSDAEAYSVDDVRATLQGLRRRAENKDDAYFAFRGLAGARAFLQLHRQLSAVLVVAPRAVSEALFHHPLGRHPMPADLSRAAANWHLAARIGPPAEPT